MLTFPLEPTDHRANPIFKNAASCAHWLRQLQLTNLQQAQQQLLTQVNELNRFPMAPLERLSTMEELRETVAHVQNSSASKLIGKPLPLAQQEFLGFAAIVQLWQAMLLGYQRCLQAYLSGNHDLEKFAPMICQRCMLYSGHTILEQVRAGYEFDGRLWHELHQLYDLAETQDWVRLTIPDPVPGNHPASCASTYIKILLTCYARPSELGRTQLQWLDTWLSEWSTQLGVAHTHSSSREVPALALDMASTQGFRPHKQIAHSGSARYVEMNPLSKVLRVNTVLLEQGKTPQELKLGNINAKDCLRFLNFLHQCWCENLNTRLTEREPVSCVAQLCCQMEQIYTHLNGKPFKQPAIHDTVKHALAFKQATVLDQTAPGQSRQTAVEYTAPLEVWHVDNESILGAQLTRETVEGQRIGFNQLLALHLQDQPDFVMAATAWVNVLRTGQLRLGAKYLPGKAVAITIRTTDTQPGQINRHAPAFRLDPPEMLKIPASLILPRNWFQPGRTIEILAPDGSKQSVVLGFSVERGIDYERVSFKPA
jgi:hypothetical protein